VLLLRHHAYVYFYLNRYTFLSCALQTCSDDQADTILYISWYDHEGVITTDGFDVAKYLSHYLALLFILQRFNHSDWGRCGHSPFDKMPQSDQANYEVKIQDETFLVDLTQAGLVHKSLAIGGRSSCLRTCEKKEGDSCSKKKYVIKFSWKEGTRVSEGDMMRHIREKAVNEPKVLDFIPDFVTDAVFSDISTENIRKSLGVHSNPRQFVVVVMVKLEGTIMDLTGDDLWKVFWDCFRCKYHSLEPSDGCKTF
jgi:Fungal protein kinase